MSVLPRVAYKWRVWLHGLWNASIASACTSVYVVVIDKDFNPFQGGWDKFTQLLVGGAIVGFILYMREHPLPDPDKDTDANSVSVQKIQEIRAMSTGDGQS